MPIRKQLNIRQPLVDELNDEQMPSLLKRIYAARGVTDKSQLDYSVNQLLNPNDLYGLQQAAQFVAVHLMQQTRCLIVGDYDADGATGTALLVKGLRQLGWQVVDYVLPDRLTEGYGLSESLVERIVAQKPDIVITVDTGIASVAGVKSLKEKNIDVVITDHHLPADQLPDADCIVNPNAYSVEISSYGRNLSGVGVAFYLLLALRSELREEGFFSDTFKQPNLALLLDLVALGTVADLVPLDHLNRVLVHQGLELIRQQRCCAGIKALFQVSQKNITQASHQDLGFAIGPRVNAAGRIDDMAMGVNCLLADSEQALLYAQQLHDLNSQRKSLQQEMEVDTESLLIELQQQQNLKDLSYPKGIVLWHQDWHEGVVGIVASKIKLKTYRPTIVFANSDQGVLKGSGRSISGIHLRDVLDLVDKQNPQMIIKFGGHAMAAGLSIEETKLSEFTEAFNQVLTDCTDESIFLENKLTDGELAANEISLSMAETLSQAGPWGQHFAEPEFVGTFKVLQQKTLKEQHLKFVLELPSTSEDSSVDGIAFFCNAEQLDTHFDTITICYKLSINEFRGERQVQLLISDILAS